MSRLSIDFLGAAGTVTGSKYLLSDGEGAALIDCGLFQGLKELRARNREAADPALRRATDLVLTHAHIDHSGYLPKLVRDGWRGNVVCSEATADLCSVLLPDSGHLQEKDASYANRKGFSKHDPAEPLYTQADAKRALELFSPAPFHTTRRIAGGLATVELHRAGHILGAAIAVVEWAGRRIVFSGDLGRYNDAILPAPEAIAQADHVIVESTYGNRRHEQVEPANLLGDIIERTIGRGGSVVVPAFAVGRAQTLLYHLSTLRAQGRLRDVPIFLDSPMAVDASEMFCAHPSDHKLDRAACKAACGAATYVRDVEESKGLNADSMPKVILSASGMATGGRVLHHLKHYAPDPRNTILFAGYQAAGTRGAVMVAGARTVKIHGEQIPVRAEVANLPILSGHADADEIMRWLSGFQKAPRRTFVTHGEPDASAALAARIESELGWNCEIPVHGQHVELG